MNKRKRMVSILAGIMAAIMILSLIFSILPTHVSAASSSEIRKQINALKDDREEIKNKMAELQEQYEANSNDIRAIVARKDVIDQEIGLLHQEIININEQISAYNVLIADRQDELERAETKFEDLNDDCKVRIRAMEEEGSVSYWEVLFKANSFADLLDRLNMVEEIAASDTERLQELTDAANRVAAVQDELANEKAELESAKAELDAAQATLDEKREEVDALFAEMMQRAAEMEQLQKDLEQEEADLLETIALKEQEYNEAKELEWIQYMLTYTTVPPSTQAPVNGGDSSGGSNNGSTGNGSNSGSSGGSNVNVGSSWIIPCSYSSISSPFGLRESPTAGASTYHQGVDLRAPAGTPIYASRGGTVTVATYGSAAGYYVTINHGDGFSTVYMHMTSYAVSAGQSVSQGQLIGYVGKTGVATGNHLHFGIAYNGAYVNPCNYVALY